MPSQDVGIASTAARGLSNGTASQLWLDASGAQVVIDFFAKCVLDGNGFQVRAGTITTPLVGDVAITDTAAEFCADCVAGTTIIPVHADISIRAGTGAANEFAIKSVATVSSAGTAFTPLPLRSGGRAASSTARVTAAGGVTVTAELATTTLRHWSYSQQAVSTAITIVKLEWEPRRPPMLNGARCVYCQIAAATTGPSYYASLDYLELTNSLIGQG
jgi:hypothetical protein